MGVFLFNVKNALKVSAKDVLDQNDFVGVEVSLTDLDLGNGTSRNIAAAELQLNSKLLLGHTDLLP